MRHYRITPVRLAPDGLQWVACAEDERERYAIECQHAACLDALAWSWFADLSPHCRSEGERVVAFLNANQA